jgi:hypothetical protein
MGVTTSLSLRAETAPPGLRPPGQFPTGWCRLVVPACAMNALGLQHVGTRPETVESGCVAHIIDVDADLRIGNNYLLWRGMK